LRKQGGELRVDAPPPLIGANYSHLENANCSLDDTGIIRHYDLPGVRARVKAQLVAMRQPVSKRCGSFSGI
jgi:hypothetical protein